MQSKDELETWYDGVDPWGYQTNMSDIRRKEVIITALLRQSPEGYYRALDIGAGEGWVTKDLPAREIDAIELSDKAAARFTDNIRRVPEPIGVYDLVTTMGTLYDQYDRAFIERCIIRAQPKTLLVAGISNWLRIPGWLEAQPPRTKHTTMLPYREFTQYIAVYDLRNFDWGLL